MKKKVILLLSFTIVIIFGFNNILPVRATNNNTSTQTIVVSAPENSDSNNYPIYKMKGKKMIKTSRSVKISNKKGIIHWKATKKMVNGRTWWKIGKNKYFKSTRVEIINMKRMKEINRKVSNYAN